MEFGIGAKNGDCQMYEGTSIDIAQESRSCAHALRTTIGPAVVILNRTRSIVVAIDLRKVPTNYLRWEGRGDRLLLFWKVRVFNSNDCITSVYARAIALPCDVEFSNVVQSVIGCRITLRLPKQVLKLKHCAGQSVASNCPDSPAEKVDERKTQLGNSSE